jgi:uncharacterized membrane protein
MTSEFEKTDEDRQVDLVIANILRHGVLISSAIVGTGGIAFLTKHHAEPAPSFAVFHGEPAFLCSLNTIFVQAFRGNSAAVIQLGVLILMATPVLRVVFGLLAFAKQRDYVFVCVTLFVLSVLLYSILAGKNA